MKPGFLILAAALMSALTACGSKRVAVKNDTIPPTAHQNVGTQDSTLQKLAFVQKVTDNQVYATNIVGKMNFKIEMGDKDISVPGALRMRKDKVIRLQLFIPLLGSEVGRLEFTPSYVLVVDRLHKQYVKADYNELDFLRNNGLSFYSLQALFWNQLMLPGTEKLSHSDLRKFDADLSASGDNVPLVLRNGNLTFNWTALKESGRITEAVVNYDSKAHGRSTLDWHYSDFRAVGVKMFPANQVFSFSSMVNNKLQKATVYIEMNDVKTDSNWEEQSTISDKYKQVDAKDVLGKFLTM